MYKQSLLGLIAVAFCLLFTSCQVGQEKKALKLNELFTNHMVLQQNEEVAFWGEYTPGKEVTVSGSWGKEATTTAENNGNWTLNLPTPEAGGPFTVNIVTKDSTVTINDAMIGEVWLASGQSNMEMPVKGWPPEDPINNSEEEVANANYPGIRMFTVARSFSLEPLDTIIGQWEVASPETAGEFSATAYFFARRLHQELNIPIGIIHASWGGTVAEAWTSKGQLKKLGDFDKDIEILEDSSLLTRPNILKLHPNLPTVLYNGMLHPIIPFTIKGAIWYQGESNVSRAEQYKKLFPAMIEDWRTQWKNDFPFYFVQIAPYQYHKSSDVSLDKSQKLRDAQRLSLKTKNTGMAVTMDIGNFTNIHPANKQEVGARLAGLALANDYGKQLVASGPLYKSFEKSENKLILDFDYKGTGLMAKESLSKFEIAGADKIFVSAVAKIVDNKVLVFAASIAQPEYVRYAWRDNGIATLFNNEGLPASSFTTEE